MLLPHKYESILVDEYAIQKLQAHKYLELGRKHSYGTSDSDGKYSSSNDSSMDGRMFRFDSRRSSVSLSNLYSPPYAQIQLRYYYDLEKNVFNVHISNCDHFPYHPAFGEQGDYFIKIQLLTNKLLKKFKDAYKKHCLSLQWSTKHSQQQEQVTKHLSRIANGVIICNEHLQFNFESTKTNSTTMANTVVASSMRILLYCCDRYGIQDLMFEQWIHLQNLNVKSFCKPNEQVQQIEFKQFPKISYGEIYLALSYLPTAERLTITLLKLRWFCKVEQNSRADVTLTCTFFHHGRRFYQEKFESVEISDDVKEKEREINDIITSSIPKDDIKNVNLYIDFSVSALSKESISCASIVLGEKTRFESDWSRMIDQPRQLHNAWYPLYG